MQLLEKIEIDYKGQKKFIELYEGDLTTLSPDEFFDLLIISAFPNDYVPTPSSLVGALHRKGLLMSYVAMTKEIDMRDDYACWLSKKIEPTKYSGLEFNRILCFEPLLKDLPPNETIGDLFKALMTIAPAYKIRSIGMPLIITGDANYPIKSTLISLIEAAVNWMNLGLEIDKIKIVAYSQSKANQALDVFKELKTKYSKYQKKFSKSFDFNYFISYSHANNEDAEYLYTKLKQTQPNCKIFMDRHELKLGHAWQEEIFEALDNCRNIITLLSKEYVNSKVCKEEYHIAHFRQRESDYNVLLPIYLYSCDLPTYIKLTQYTDCREGDKKSLDHAALVICSYQS